MNRLCHLSIMIALLAGTLAASASRLRYGVAVIEDLSYTNSNNHQQSLDLYQPKDRQTRPPLLIYLHGGAWVSGDKSEFANVGRAFAEEGIATAVVNYRLSSNRRQAARHPDHVNDCAVAFAWLREHANTYGYDADKVVIMGHSAGAQIAGLLALNPTYLAAVDESRAGIRGIIGIQGIYDLPALAERFSLYQDKFLDAAFGEAANWSEASPVTHAEADSAPWLLIHSPQDRLVNKEQSREFARHLREHGTRAWLNERIYKSHNRVITTIGSRGYRVTKQAVAFVRAMTRNQ